MRSITNFSLRNIAFVIIVMLLVLVGGGLSAASMGIEQYPNVNVPYLSIHVPYVGASSSQVLEDVSKPLESELSTIHGLQNLYSTSSPNGANMVMEFDINTDINKAQDEVNQALNRVTLPADAGQATISKMGPTSTPIYIFSVSNAAKTQSDISDYVQQKIEPALSTISGVSEVQVEGTSDKQVYVKVDPEKLIHYHLTLNQVKQALLANNISSPTGQVTMDGKQMSIQVNHQLTSITEIKKTTILLVNQNTSSTKDAFTSFGNGLNQLGQSVGDLGKAVSGNTESTALLQKELEVMNSINQLSSKLFQDQASLNQLKASNGSAKNPSTQKKIAALSQAVQREQAEIQKLQGTLTSIQPKLNQASWSSQNGLTNLQKQQAPQKVTLPSGPTLALSSIPLSKIATVTYGVGGAGTYTRLNGKPAVIVAIQPDNSGTTSSIVQNVKGKLAALNVPSGYQIQTLRDESIQINQSVHSMLREAILGAIIASLVTMLFLRNLKTTIVAIISIPLSILATMIVMKLMGYTLNTMTLAGVAVAIGRVVDDSIVVIENIYRKAREAIHEKTFGTSFILDSTQEVGQAITSSTITTIAVFLPMGFVPGIVGKFFAPFAWSVVISIAFSLIIALTLVPILSKLFLGRLKVIEKRDNALQRFYERFLRWGLMHRWRVLLLAAILLIGTLLVTPKIPVNFFPDEAVQFVNVDTTLPNGTSLGESNQLAKEIEQDLQGMKAVKNYDTVVKAARVSVEVTLNKHEDSTAFQNNLKLKTDQLGKGSQTTITPVGGAPSSNSLSIIVNGPDSTTINSGTQLIHKKLSQINGISEITANSQDQIPQITVNIDDKKATAKGVYPATLASVLHDLISGTSITDVQINGTTTHLNLGLQSNRITNLKAIQDQQVTNVLGDQVKIGDIASVKQTEAPAAIQRLNQQAYNSLNVQLDPISASKTQQDIKKTLKETALPKGVSYSFKGTAQEMKQGFRNLIYAILLSIVLVYLVMMLAFREARAPLSILFSLPFIFVGVIWGIFVTHESLGIPALVGILMLVGIVVTNAIVLIDKVKQNQLIHEDSTTAIVEAGKTRIRPILMTAVATVGALFPLALSTEGGLISRSLAIVVISGLTASTLLTLIIVPVSFSLLSSKK